MSLNRHHLHPVSQDRLLRILFSSPLYVFVGVPEPSAVLPPQSPSGSLTRGRGLQSRPWASALYSSPPRCSITFFLPPLPDSRVPEAGKVEGGGGPPISPPSSTGQPALLTSSILLQLEAAASTLPAGHRTCFSPSGVPIPAPPSAQSATGCTRSSSGTGGGPKPLTSKSQRLYLGPHRSLRGPGGGGATATPVSHGRKVKYGGGGFPVFFLLQGCPVSSSPRSPPNSRPRLQNRP